MTTPSAHETRSGGTAAVGALSPRTCSTSTPRLRIKLHETFRDEDYWLTPDPEDPAHAVVGNDPSPWTPLALVPH